MEPISPQNQNSTPQTPSQQPTPPSPSLNDVSQPDASAAPPSRTAAPTSSTPVAAPTMPSNPTPGAASPAAGVVVSPQSNVPTGGKVFQPGKSKRHLPMKLLIPVIVLIMLVGSGAYAYFGYYMSSSVVWKQSLGNMNTGYDKLLSYLNQNSTSHYKGASEDGSFKVNDNGTNYDGSLSASSDGKSSTISAKLDLGVSKLDVEERSLPSSTGEPDIYLQVSGIKQVDSALGGELGPQIDGLDGQWIVIDHNLLNDLKSIVAKSQKSQASTPVLTWKDVYSFLQAAGTVDKQYVFTTDPGKAVTTVVKTYGKEAVDGHHTIHYQVGFVPAHVKAYVTAMCSALQSSDLGTYLYDVTGQPVATTSECKDLESSAGNIKSSDTVDVWADTSTRLIYKVRVPESTTNAAENFLDVGLNYKGGSSYPFFLSGEGKEGNDITTFSLTATLDSKTNAITAALQYNDKSDTTLAITGNFTIKPSNDTLVVPAPTGATPLTTVLNNLGFGDYVTLLQSLGTNSQLTNSKLKPLPQTTTIPPATAQSLLTSLALTSDLTRSQL